MDKANFGSLISKLADDLPDPYPYNDGQDEINEGKSITPPPGFDEAANEDKKKSPSRSATLR